MFRVDFKHNFNYINILKTNIIKMKTLILGTLLILAVVFFGCDNNPVNPVNEVQTDKVALTVKAVTIPTVCVTTQYESTIYEYEKIFSDGVMLNITFPDCIGGNCGISIELSSIIYYETFK